MACRSISPTWLMSIAKDDCDSEAVSRLWMRLKMRSMQPRMHLLAGTKQPACAMMGRMPTVFRYTDLPARHNAIGGGGGS